MRFILATAILLMGSTVMAKTYEGRIVLKDGPATSVPVSAEANSPSEAKRIIEAQYHGRIKRWFKTPSPKR